VTPAERRVHVDFDLGGGLPDSLALDNAAGVGDELVLVMEMGEGRSRQDVEGFSADGIAVVINIGVLAP